jgi:SAM-dependent methyltransferase
MALPTIVRQVAKGAGKIPVVGNVLRRLAGDRVHLPFKWRHPFDAEFGVDTSGFVTQRKLVSDREFADKISFYVPMQPSLVRRVLSTLPEVREYDFLDLGCGKGRPLIVASELPFKKITGVEIAHKLVQVARKNAAIIRKNFPQRTPIEIQEGNAVAFPLEGRRLVLLFYNPFNAELMTHVLRNIEKALAGATEHVFIVYHNSVWAHLFDASPHLKRWYADQFVCAPEEQGFGYHTEGATVVWQSVKNAFPDRHERANRRVVVFDKITTGLAD